MQLSDNVKKGIAVVVIVGVSYAFGRFSAPEKVKIETKIVTVEKKVRSKDKRKETKVVEITKPDGTKEKTKTIVEDTKTDTVTDKVATTDKVVERVRASSRTSISVLVGGSIISGPSGNVAIGGHVSRDLIGPISVGVWGLSSGTFGGSVGISF